VEEAKNALRFESPAMGATGSLANGRPYTDADRAAEEEFTRRQSAAEASDKPSSPAPQAAAPQVPAASPVDTALSLDQLSTDSTPTTLSQAAERIRELEERLANLATATASKPKRDRTEKLCTCGCGEITKSFFAMGHDAKLKSLMQKGEVDPDSIPVETQEALSAQSASWDNYWNGTNHALWLTGKKAKQEAAAERMLAAEANRQARAEKSAKRKETREKVASFSTSTASSRQPALSKVERERASLQAAMADMRSQGYEFPDDVDEDELDVEALINMGAMEAQGILNGEDVIDERRFHGDD